VRLRYFKPPPSPPGSLPQISQRLRQSSQSAEYTCKCHFPAKAVFLQMPFFSKCRFLPTLFLHPLFLCSEPLSVSPQAHPNSSLAFCSTPWSTLQVHAKPKAAPDQMQYMVDWISANYPLGDSGIVYCLTRKDTEQVAGELSQRGLACRCYHADMDAQDRQTCHMQWSTGIYA